MRTGAPVRSLVLWFPDWPVTALSRSGAHPLDPGAAIAVMENNTVAACSAAARAEGVRRGQRRRDAQSLCPGLTVVAADPLRDQRAFAPVVALIEERAPGVQIVRPGLCALRIRGPARYYGGEVDAARVLLAALRNGEPDEVREPGEKGRVPGAPVGGAPIRVGGLEGVRAGIADGPFTAEQAARIGTGRTEPVCVVPAGGAPGFLAPLSVASLIDASAALGSGAELVDLLARLGVKTLGQFAAMERDRVLERFGERGIRLHALAAGQDSSDVEPRDPPPELHREIAFEPPLEMADQVAFGIRIAADEFIAGLGAIGLVCTELRVELAGDRGERSERVWLHPGSFDAASVVDRVRWQLSEAAQERAGRSVLESGVALVRIAPEKVEAASHHAPAIFGAGAEERVHHTLSRVQAMLGHRGVVTPAIGGGRWLAERQVMVPWGDRVVLAEERARPWPGSLPDPLPGTVFFDPLPVEVTATGGAAVDVDGRGRVSAAPGVLVEGGRRRAIEAWAGPWPIIERGWDAARARRAYRLQVVDADRMAWLLVCENGAWTAEARFD